MKAANESNIKLEFLDLSLSQHKQLALFGSVLYFLFGTIYDSLLLPFNFLHFLYIKLAGCLIILLSVFVVNRYKASPNILGYVTMLTLGVSISYMCGRAGTDSFSSYTLNFSLVFLGSSFFILWRPIHSIIISVLLLLTYCGWSVLFFNIPFEFVFSHGFLIAITTLIIFVISTNIKYGISKRELLSKLRLLKLNTSLSVKATVIQVQNSNLEIFKKSIEHTSDGVIILRLSPYDMILKDVIYCNKAFCKLIEFKPQSHFEFLKLFFPAYDSSYSESHYRCSPSFRNMHKSYSEGNFSYESKFKRKDEEELFVDIKYTFLEDNSNGTYFIGFLRDITAKKINEGKAISEKLQRHLVMVNKINEAQENERKRFATDIHDGAGQMLTAAKLNLALLLSKASQDDKIFIQLTYDLVVTTIQEMRNIAYDILPPSIEQFGIISALTELCNKALLEKNSIYFISNITKLSMNKKSSLQLYRVVQEAVNNILKHSNATIAHVNLLKIGRRIFLIITDNGKGFDIQNVKGGHGLRNLKTRAEIIGGDLTFTSEFNRGTTIELAVKLNENTMN